MAITRTPIIDDDGTGTTGTVIDNAWKTELYNQIDGVVGGVWTAYTPTWSNSGTTQPAIGNGTVTGSYVVVGKTVHFEAILVAGTTTTFGDAAGFFAIGLPPPPPKTLGGRVVFGFSAGCLSGAGAAYPPALAYAFNATQMYFIIATGGAGALIGPTAPFAWSSGATITVRGTYQTT